MSCIVCAQNEFILTVTIYFLQESINSASKKLLSTATPVNKALNKVDAYINNYSTSKDVGVIILFVLVVVNMGCYLGALCSASIKLFQGSMALTSILVLALFIICPLIIIILVSEDVK